MFFFTLACQATITGSFFGVGSPGEKITEYYSQKGRMVIERLQRGVYRSEADMTAVVHVLPVVLRSQYCPHQGFHLRSTLEDYNKQNRTMDSLQCHRPGYNRLCRH